MNLEEQSFDKALANSFDMPPMRNIGDGYVERKKPIIQKTEVLELIDEEVKKAKEDNLEELLEKYVQCNYVLYRIAINEFQKDYFHANIKSFFPKKNPPLEFLEKTQRWLSSALKNYAKIKNLKLEPKDNACKNRSSGNHSK